MWLLVGNLSCVWELINKFSIRFTPESFELDAPGESGSVLAELLWDDSAGRLDALSWSVDPGIPHILTSATCSPTSESSYTQVYLRSSDNADLFPPSNVWGASEDSVYQLGVKARFVDPVWKSLSGGQELVLTRNAYLPIRLVGLTRIRIQNLGWNRDNTLAFKLRVESPRNGWHYFFTVESRSINFSGMVFSFKDPRTELSHSQDAIINVYPGPRPYRKASVRFVLEFIGSKGQVSTQVRNYPIGSIQ